jgi:hypothetical protein
MEDNEFQVMEKVKIKPKMKLKIRIEYTVEINSKAEKQILLQMAIDAGLGDSKTPERELLKRLFQAKGEHIRGQSQ